MCRALLNVSIVVTETAGCTPLPFINLQKARSRWQNQWRAARRLECLTETQATSCVTGDRGACYAHGDTSEGESEYLEKGVGGVETSRRNSRDEHLFCDKHNTREQWEGVVFMGKLFQNSWIFMQNILRWDTGNSLTAPWLVLSARNAESQVWSLVGSNIKLSNLIQHPACLSHSWSFSYHNMFYNDLSSF